MSSSLSSSSSRSAVELDFFRMEKESSASPPTFERRRSFRDIQGVISKINPEVLKTVIANGLPKPPVSVPPSPVHDSTTNIRQLGSCENKRGSETTPMTIFYNGMVAVFDVPPHKAQDILVLAEQGVQKAVESADSQQVTELSSRDQEKNMLGTSLNGDFPIARRKSLQRFLEKRKERSNMVEPYGCPKKHFDFSPQRIRLNK